MKSVELHHRDYTVRQCMHQAVEDKGECNTYPSRHISGFYRRMESVLSRRLSCSSHKFDGQDCAWTYIPLSNGEFLRAVENIRVWEKGRDLKFLDVGCGFGMKVWLASNLGFSSHGIDLCKKYINFAKIMFKGEEKVSFEYANALKYNDYGNFDIVYMYHPIRSRELMEQLLQRMSNQMKVGSYIAAKMFDLSPDKSYEFVGTSSQVCIWKKKGE